MFLAFFGKYRGDRHPHESPPVMLVPLVVLALLSLGGGFLFKIPAFLGTVFPSREVDEDLVLMAISTAAGVIGILLAWLMYVARPGMADAFAGSVKGLYTLVYNKYFVDELYDAAVVRPLVGGSRVVLWKGVDAGLIDGAVNGVGGRAQRVGGVLKLLQSGNIRSYATWIVLGSVAVIVALVEGSR
jgi:NADH-quinone oxidoreductase subunit L